MKVFFTPSNIFKNIIKKKTAPALKLAEPAKSDIVQLSTKNSFTPLKFKKSQSIEEASKYARTYFKIKNYDVKDLAHANIVNRTISKIYNLTNGRASFPDRIKVIRNSQARYLGNCNDNAIEVVNCPEIESVITHEIAHYNHYLLAKNYSKMGKISEMQDIGITDFSIFNEFKNNKQAQKLIKKHIRPYATSSPAEFIACTFEKIINGKKLPQEIKELYKKYEGPFSDIFCV